MKCLGISLTIAYSGLFTGLESLPGVYDTASGLTLLKVRLGSGSLISPFQLEEMRQERTEITPADEDALSERMLLGDTKAVPYCLKISRENLAPIPAVKSSRMLCI